MLLGGRGAAEERAEARAAALAFAAPAEVAEAAEAAETGGRMVVRGGGDVEVTSL